MIQIARAASVPVALENPAASRLLVFPPFKKLLKASDCQKKNFDMCSYGTRWRKLTAAVSWGWTFLAQRGGLCTGKKGFCSFSGMPHIELSGRDKVSKCLWTSLAQTYPSRFCNDLADSLVQASGQNSFSNMWLRFGGLKASVCL